MASGTLHPGQILRGSLPLLSPIKSIWYRNSMLLEMLYCSPNNIFTCEINLKDISDGQKQVAAKRSEVHTQNVSGGIVNILGGGSTDYSE
jgi:hypothetical protein